MDPAIEITSICRRVSLGLTSKDVKEGIDNCYNKQKLDWLKQEARESQDQSGVDFLHI
jgi:hypothetical protein